MARRSAVVAVGEIRNRILLIRGERVILDSDFSAFYGVPTKRLNEQVRRNRARFPDDFVFRLTGAEKVEVVASCDHLSKLKYSRALPRAFTESGALMAASVLNSERAVSVSIFIVRAFVGLREVVAHHKDLARRLSELERRLGMHDAQIAEVVAAIRQLLSPRAVPKKRRIGFDVREP
jgi:hypothetical protein